MPSGCRRWSPDAIRSGAQAPRLALGGEACAPFMALCVPRRGHPRDECIRRDGEEEEVETLGYARRDSESSCESIMPGVADIWSAL